VECGVNQVASATASPSAESAETLPWAWHVSGPDGGRSGRSDSLGAALHEMLDAVLKERSPTVSDPEAVRHEYAVLRLRQIQRWTDDQYERIMALPIKAGSGLRHDRMMQAASSVANAKVNALRVEMKALGVEKPPAALLAAESADEASQWHP
jgi:hypothetical protein